MYIKIKDLNFSYNDKVIFENYQASILKNRFNAVVGPSGSGKTTLLRIISGLEQNYTADITNIKNYKVSMCFQENRLLENYTIKENINLVQEKDISDLQLEKELNNIGLDIDVNKKVKELSGGMKRRIAILRSVLYEADLYILDEPFKELDKKNYYIATDYVKSKLENKTVIFTTHNELEIDLFWANVINCY